MSNSKSELIEKFRRSGLNVPTFCKQEGLNVHTFRSWLYKGLKNPERSIKRKSQPKSPTFYPVESEADKPREDLARGNRIIIEFPEGLRITIER